jgi:hypothetical protein
LLHDEKIETLVDRDSVDPTRFGGKDYDKYAYILFDNAPADRSSGNFKDICGFISKRKTRVNTDV